MKKTNIAVIGDECVACGACVKVCPLGAVRIDRGITAVVDSEGCVGCGKCAAVCPAGVVVIAKREEIVV
jgi:2-oxoglutarate ferredoxin oxidoreductase subunit delta